MIAEKIRKLCLAKKGTTESIKWGDHLCFSVGDKMYLVVNPDAFPVSCSFKAPDNLFDALISRDGMIPAPYMARHKWVFTDDIKNIASKEWTSLINSAYNAVFEKLPLKKQKQINEMVNGK